MKKLLKGELPRFEERRPRTGITVAKRLITSLRHPDEGGVWSHTRMHLASKAVRACVTRHVCRLFQVSMVPEKDVNDMAGKKATTEQLRDDIDRGRTGEKVNVSDPAAAPLGTDEEAAGTPLDGAVVAEVRDRELAKAPPGRPGYEADPSNSRHPVRRRLAPMIAIIVALVALAALIWSLLS
jgi:hypothetical protein